MGECLFLATRYAEAKTVFESLLKRKPDYHNRARIDEMLIAIPAA
jgi:hypothetical protein